MKWLLENFWIKIVAFIMGLLIWLHVATEKTYNYELMLPVNEVSLQDDLSLAKEPPDSLLVSVSATGKQLLRKKWREEGLRISANQYQAGRYTVNLNTANTFLVSQTGQISLDEVIAPTSAQFEIDIRATAEVTVKADIETYADEGFAIGQRIEITPPEAKLVGPRSLVSGVSSVMTEHKQLGGLRNSVSLYLHLVPPTHFAMSVEPESVLVTIPVVPVKTKVFEDMPVIIFNPPPTEQLKTDPELVRVEITGLPEEIDSLDRNKLTVSVDYNDMTLDSLAALKVDCPAGFRLKRASVDSVRIVSDTDVNSGH